MHNINLLPYSSLDHKEYLDKWLTDDTLMHGWGMSPFILEDIDPWTKDPTRVILMIEDIEQHQVVGLVNFYKWDKENQTASRGTLIDPQFQNQGYGKEAIKASNDYAFDEMGLKRIELYVEGDNDRSRHVTEKLGYEFDRYDKEKDRYYYHMERK